MSNHEEFCAGERPEDVALYLDDDVVSGELSDHGVELEDGVLLIVDGERGRRVVRMATEMDAMDFAAEAMDRDGEIADDLTGGVCPNQAECSGDDHDAQFIFAFAEAQNEEVGGRYADGPVLHAYARCACGCSYSERWSVGQ